MEFTLEHIKEAAVSEQLYQQAYELYQEQAVVSIECDETSNPLLYIVQGVIRQEKKYYQVSLSIEKDDVDLKAYICNCKEHNPYQPCVHVIALLFKLYEKLQKQQTLKQPHSLEQEEAFMKVLNTYEQQMIYSSLALNLQTKIHLEPVIEIKDHVLAITLKIGQNKMYRIKDIPLFLDDMEQHVHKSYGKELSFYHHRNSFDEESKVLLSFLMKHRYDSLYYQSQPKYHHLPSSRNLCLSKSAVDEWLEIYQECEMYERVREKKLLQITFTKKAPQLTLQIRKRFDENYELFLTKNIRHIIWGDEQMVVVIDQMYHHCDYAYTKNCSPLLSALQENNTLLISKEAMPSFYNTILLSIEPYIQILGDDISMFAPQPLECKLYLDSPFKNRISAKLEYNYGNMNYNALLDTAFNNARNVHEELSVRMLLSRYMNKVDMGEGIFYIEDNMDQIYEFLSKGYEQLCCVCSVYATEALKNMLIQKKKSISVGVRMDSDLLYLNFDTEDFPKEELADLLRAFRWNKKYYRMKNGAFIDLEDSAFHDLGSLLNGLKINETQLKSGNVELPIYRSLYLDQQLKETSFMKIDRDERFKTVVRDMKNIEDCDYKVPLPLKNTLRNYQKVGFRWLKTMSNYGFGGILADDMGIGKTLQVITLLLDLKYQDATTSSLVVCPASLMLNWESEIEKFAPELSTCLLVGNAEQRQRRIKGKQHYDVYITSYDYLKRDLEAYDDKLFTYQIIDEAQYIKNHSTKNALSVKHIQAKHRFALTGTPIENSLAELWSIFDFLMPDYLYSYSYFKNEYEYPIVREKDRQTLNELKRLVEPFILRRVKKDVLKELPEKVEHNMYIELDEENKKVYQALTMQMKEEILETMKKDHSSKSRYMALAMLTRLRQAACDPRLLYENYNDSGSKMKACMEIIETSVQSKKKILVFSQFTSLLSLLEQELQNKNIKYYLLKGSTPKIQRQQYVHNFQQDDTPVFLISLKAGGTGLNLTKAEVVLHFDPWWNVSAQNQATDRAYRLGQHNNVQVMKLIAKGTVEEKIQSLQIMKQNLSDSIIHQNDDIISKMDMNDLLALFD